MGIYEKIPKHTFQQADTPHRTSATPSTTEEGTLSGCTGSSRTPRSYPGNCTKLAGHVSDLLGFLPSGWRKLTLLSQVHHTLPYRSHM